MVWALVSLSEGKVSHLKKLISPLFSYKNHKVSADRPSKKPLEWNLNKRRKIKMKEFYGIIVKINIKQILHGISLDYQN